MRNPRARGAPPPPIRRQAPMIRKVVLIVLLALLSGPAAGQEAATAADVRRLLKEAESQEDEARSKALHSLVDLARKGFSALDAGALSELARAIPKHLRDLAGFPSSETDSFWAALMPKLEAPIAEEVAQGLLTWAEGEDARVALTAWRALDELFPRLEGKTAERIAAAMLGCLEDGEAAALDQTALSILGRAGTKVPADLRAKAAGAVGEVMNDTTSELRIDAAWALGNLAAALADRERGLALQEAAVETLAGFLAGDGLNRLSASILFIDLGPRLRGRSSWKAADALSKRLRDDSEAIRNNCCQALVGIVPALAPEEARTLLSRIPDPADERDEMIRSRIEELRRALQKREEGDGER